MAGAPAPPAQGTAVGGSGTHPQALPDGTSRGSSPVGSRVRALRFRGLASAPGSLDPGSAPPCPARPSLKPRGHRVREGHGPRGYSPRGAAPTAALLTGHGSPWKHHARRGLSGVSGPTQEASRAGRGGATCRGPAPLRLRSCPRSWERLLAVPLQHLPIARCVR